MTPWGQDDTNEQINDTQWMTVQIRLILIFEVYMAQVASFVQIILIYSVIVG